jgi:hypothetical protein
LAKPNTGLAVLSAFVAGVAGSAFGWLAIHIFGSYGFNSFSQFHFLSDSCLPGSTPTMDRSPIRTVSELLA